MPQRRETSRTSTLRERLRAARQAYERLVVGRTLALIRRVASSDLDFSERMDAVAAPVAVIAEAAGFPTTYDDRSRLTVLVLAYPYALDAPRLLWDFGSFVSQHPRAHQAFRKLVARDAPESASFVRELRDVLLRSKQGGVTQVDWTAIGEGIWEWESSGKIREQWRKSFERATKSTTVEPARLGVTPKSEPIAEPSAARSKRSRLGVTASATSGAAGRDGGGKSRSTLIASNGATRWIVRWLKGHAYGYRRVYVGAAGHGRPRYVDTYLGRLDDDIAKSGNAEAIVRALKRNERRRRGGGR